MSSTLNRLTAELANLPAIDRAELAKFLLDSLEEEVETPETVSKAWDLELEKRVQRIRSGEAKGIPASTIFPSLGNPSP